MEIRHLPVIDWELAMHLAGQKKDLAVEILTAFTEQLPKELEKINLAYETKNFPDLLYLVHKLHGGLCYTGASRLKTLVSRLETELKSNIMDNLTLFMDQLNQEVSLLLERHSLLPT